MVVGCVDVGEIFEVVVLCEVVEEIGLQISCLLFGLYNYFSFGVMVEYLYLYVGIVDLFDDVVGFGGLDIEDEDICSYLILCVELIWMVMVGEIRNGLLLVLVFWLELLVLWILLELLQYVIV